MPLATVWEMLSKESQDRLIVLMYLLLLKEHPDGDFNWIPPTSDNPALIAQGNIEGIEEIDRLMRVPTKIRRPHR